MTAILKLPLPIMVKHPYSTLLIVCALMTFVLGVFSITSPQICQANQTTQGTHDAPQDSTPPVDPPHVTKSPSSAPHTDAPPAAPPAPDSATPKEASSPPVADSSTAPAAVPSSTTTPPSPPTAVIAGLPQSEAAILGEIIKGCQAGSANLKSTEAAVASTISASICQDGDYQTCLKNCFENTVCNETCPCLNDCYATCSSFIPCGNWSNKDITTKFNSYIDASSF